MKTLAIMAAGMGSRYGGLKQLDTIDKNGHSIIDYSIYDAVQAGFDHIVFIIRTELHQEFIERFSHLESDSLTVSYVMQEINDVPAEFNENTREKPWGTGHALLALRHQVKNNFALINADDFYGKQAFKVMYDALFNTKNDNYFMVGYKLKNTLSKFGSVSRGQCFIDETSTLQKIIERMDIYRTADLIRYAEDTGKSTSLDKDTLVSMNFWGFTPTVFNHAEQLFNGFLKDHYTDPKIEFFIPSIINVLVDNKKIYVKVLSTDCTWYGITYKEDKAQLVKAIDSMIDSGMYPGDLWQSTDIETVFNYFNHKENYKAHSTLTSGHINDTYKIETVSGNDFILQRLNASIFNNIDKMVKNKVALSQYLKVASGYIVSDYIKTHSNDYLTVDRDNQSWTLCTFLENTVTFLIPKNREMAKQAGMLLGDFHKHLKSFDVESLFVTIPNFHNLRTRVDQYEDALKHANKELLNEAQDLIEVLQTLAKDAEYLDQLKTTGKIPLRVTHNDAKLSNLLFDDASLEAVAIIDLDTVMPGIIHYDIGDAVRSICSIAAEDEPDTSKVQFNLDYYKAFMEGFLPVMASDLSDTEKEMLPLSITYMLYEQALRFLTDHLNGNIYYKVEYPQHNLVRAKNQTHLLKVIIEQLKDINKITKDILVQL